MISEERFQVFVGHLETQVGGTLEKMEDIVGRISKRFGIPEVTLRNTRPLHSKESQALVSLLVRLQSVERTLERVDLELVTVHQKLQNSDGYVRQLEDTIRRRKEAIESLRRKKDLTFEEQKRELFQLLEAGEAAGTIPTQPQPEPHFEPADLKGLLSPTEPPPQELVPPPAPEQKPEPEQQPVAQEAESPEADSSSSSSSSSSDSEEEEKKKPAPSVEDLFKAERSKELASLRTNETSEELIARAESLLQRLAENTSSVAGHASASTSNSSSGITGASSTSSTISNPGGSAVDAEESASAIAAPSSGDPKAAGKVPLLSLFAPPPARSPSPCSTSAIDSVSADESAPEDSELPAQSSSEIFATPRSGKEHRRHSKKSGDADKKKKKKKSKDKEKDKEKDKAEEKAEEN